MDEEKEVPEEVQEPEEAREEVEYHPQKVSRG